MEEQAEIHPRHRVVGHRAVRIPVHAERVEAGNLGLEMILDERCVVGEGVLFFHSFAGQAEGAEIVYFAWEALAELSHSFFPDGKNQGVASIV